MPNTLDAQLGDGLVIHSKPVRETVIRTVIDAGFIAALIGISDVFWPSNEAATGIRPALLVFVVLAAFNALSAFWRARSRTLRLENDLVTGPGVGFHQQTIAVRDLNRERSNRASVFDWLNGDRRLWSVTGQYIVLRKWSYDPSALAALYDAIGMKDADSRAGQSESG